MNLNDLLFDEHGRPQITAPKAKLRDWMKDYTFELVTEETLSRVIDECIASGLYSLDLETTGLNVRVYDNRTVDQIVGFCLSPNGQVGYYIPIRHTKDGEVANLSISKVQSEMIRLEKSNSRAIFHNGKYDCELLQFCGGAPMGTWENPKKWEDTLILAYLRDSRAKRKGLKYLAKVELDMDMIELKELFPQDHPKGNLNYAFLDPNIPEVLAYAASDAIITYKLYEILAPQVIGKLAKPNQASIYQIEKACVAATRWMERCRLPIDREVVKELIELGQKEMFDALKSVYEGASKHLGREVTPAYFSLLEQSFTTEAGYPIKDQIDDCKALALRKGLADDSFIEKEAKSLLDGRKRETYQFPYTYDIMSPRQLGMLLWEIGVKVEVTEKSLENHKKDPSKELQIKTAKGDIEQLVDSVGDTYPFMAKVKLFREIQKSISTNLLPMYEDSSEDGTLKINFNGHRVDTGRFSTPGQKDKGNGLFGGTRFNLHSLPSTYDPNRPECMRRLRECVKARDNNYLVAIDFSGEELRIVTNLSLEPLWLEQFFKCSECDTHFDRSKRPPQRCPKCGSDKIGDLHTLTTLSIFGQDAKKDPRWKALRGMGKATNFSLCYGGGRGAVQRAVGVDENEGARIKAQFDKTYQGLAQWWGKQKKSAVEWGFVKTAFGRKYPVPDAMLPRRGETNGIPNGGLIAKAQRNAINGPIQGTGADILKIAMALIHREVVQRGWENQAMMIACMHDEILFEIDREILKEAIDLFVDIMSVRTVKTRGWAVPLTVDIEIGKNWKVPWDLYAIQHGEEEMPEELRPYLGEGGTPKPKKEKPKQVSEEPTQPKLTAGEVFEYSLPSTPLSYTMGLGLVDCIKRCHNSGTHPLRVVTSNGDVVWSENMGIVVSPTVFKIRAEDFGL